MNRKDRDRGAEMRLRQTHHRFLSRDEYAMLSHSAVHVMNRCID